MVGSALPPMRVLVLDSDSFIGSRVVRALAGASWATAVVIPRPRLLALNRDRAAMEAALADVDAVANCSSEVPALIYGSARALYTAAQRQPGRRIVHAGSMTVYGAASGRIDEDAPLSAELGAYAAAQLAADAIARKCPSAVLLRLGAEYGAGHRALAETLARLLIAGRVGALGPAGEGHCNAVYGDDVGHAVLAALQLPGIEGRVYNLSSTESLTWNQFLAAYAQALAVPLPVIGSGRWAWERGMAPLRKLLQIAARPVGITPGPLVSPSLARMFRERLLLDSRRAEAELGLRFTPHADALADVAAAYRRRT